MPRLDNFQIKEIGLQGLGLVSNHSYSPDELIIEYCGKITPAGPAITATRGPALSFVLNFVDGYMLDVTKYASAARFINHSCHPNAQLQLWNVNGIPRLGVFAIEHITLGAQITCNYNAGGFFNYGSQCKLLCHCRSFNCAGYIDTGVEPGLVLARKRIIVDDENNDDKPVDEILQKPSLILVLKYRQPSKAQNQSSLQVPELDPEKKVNINNGLHDTDQTKNTMETQDGIVAEKNIIEIRKENSSVSISLASKAPGLSISMSPKHDDDIKNQSIEKNSSTVEIKSDDSISGNKKCNVESSVINTGFVTADLMNLPQAPIVTVPPPLFDSLYAVVAHQQSLFSPSPVSELRQVKQEKTLPCSSNTLNSNNISNNLHLYHDNTAASGPGSSSTSHLSLSLQSILNKSPPPSTSAAVDPAFGSYESRDSAPLGLDNHHQLHRSDTETGSSPHNMSITSLLSGSDDEEDEIILSLSGSVKPGLLKIYEMNKANNFMNETKNTLPPPTLPFHRPASNLINSVHGSASRLPLFGNPVGNMVANYSNTLVNANDRSWSSSNTETVKSGVVVSPKLDLTMPIPRPFSSVSYTHLPVSYDNSASENTSGNINGGNTNSTSVATTNAGTINTHITNTSAGWEKLSINNLLS